MGDEHVCLPRPPSTIDGRHRSTSERRFPMSSHPSESGFRNNVGAIPGLSRQPSPAARDTLLDPNDTVMLLLDHQTGLFQTVKDVPVAELRSNTMALAHIAKLGNAPIIYTASVPDGPNGPLMDELNAIKEYATYVPRKGEI